MKTKEIPKIEEKMNENMDKIVDTLVNAAKARFLDALKEGEVEGQNGKGRDAALFVLRIHSALNSFVS